MSRKPSWFNVLKSVPYVGMVAKASASVSVLATNALNGMSWDENKHELETWNLSVDILINGTLYQINGVDKSSGCCIVDVNNERTEIEHFKWNWLADKQEIKRSDREIRAIARSFAFKKYSIRSTAESYNCQTFAVEMFKQSCCISSIVVSTRLAFSGSSFLI